MRRSEHPHFLIHAGTSVRSVDGGIALALRGHEAAARAAAIPCTLVETHVAAGMREKVGPWLRSFGEVRAAVLEARRQERIPVVWAHAGEWPSLVRKASVLRWARANGARTVLHLHAVELDAYLDREVGRRAVRRLVESADRVAVLSPWWQRRLEREDIRTQVIPNPLPPALERMAADGPRRAAADGPLRVLVMTRLVPGKGVELALRAVARMGTDVRLTVAGDGPRARPLSRLAQKLGVAVRFTGWARESAKDELFASHHVLCHASGRDAAPMVVVEAMARALPVVVLDSRSVPDLVPAETVGIIVPDPDPALLAGALERLQEADLRDALGGAGRSWALEHLAAAASVPRLTGLLASLETLET
jgi:glycosyltransferase involved in cell wall biosynthesis